jgi:hypothetical protein
MMFEKDDKFLTFPIGLGFTYRYLQFMQDPTITGLSLQEQLNNKGDFAKLMNIVPGDSPLFSPDASSLLWQRTIELLNRSIFANSALSEAEEKQLSTAIDFLTDEGVTDDGLSIPTYSAALMRYYEYKTLHENAMSTYLDEKITVDSTTGAEGVALKQQWASYREKQLKSLIDKAEQDWINLGLKQQVEGYLAVRSSLEPKKYLNLYRQSYLADIELSFLPPLNDQGLPAYTTYFSPFDAFDPKVPWTKLTLTKGEIDTLVSNSPAELKSLFNGGASALEIESISLEYNNVVVMRPWWKPEFCESRYWKLPDNTVVSDGKLPRQGMIPAYITSMLVVRNITVTRKKSAASKPIDIGVLISNPKIFKPLPGQTPPIFVPPKLEQAVMKSASALRGTVQGSPAALPKTSFVARPVQPTPIRPVGTKASEAIRVQPNISKVYVNTKYVGTTIKTPILTVPPKPANPGGTTPAQAELVTETFASEGVVVLAYVCKRIPRSPNPDAKLSWSA